MFHCGLHKSIYDFLVFKFDFLFGGMHIDIHPRRINFNKKNIERKTVTRDHLLKCRHHGMIQVGTPDKSVVHKKILVAPGAFGGIRLADKSGDIQIIGILLNGNELAMYSSHRGSARSAVSAFLFPGEKLPGRC